MTFSYWPVLVSKSPPTIWGLTPYFYGLVMTAGQNRYRVVLACDGVSVEDGSQAAIDISQEFVQRTWHQNVKCTWDGQTLFLQAENDFDPKGLALMDEFSDSICAYLRAFDADIRLVSAEVL